MYYMRLTGKSNLIITATTPTKTKRQWFVRVQTEKTDTWTNKQTHSPLNWHEHAEYRVCAVPTDTPVELYQQMFYKGPTEATENLNI